MKHLFLLIFIVAVTLASCNKHEEPAHLCMLDDIKVMGDTLPKAAIERLDSLRPEFEKESEYMRNKLALLDIRLHSKANMTQHFTMDSIKKVCLFFESNGTIAEQQEAYFYTACVYRDLYKYLDAITYFRKTAQIAENNRDIDSRLWKSTYSQLSYLYKVLYNNSEALDYAIKALDVAEKSNTVDERTYMNVASCYMKANDTLNAIRYYNRIIENADNMVIDRRNSDIIATAMRDYSLSGYKKEAMRCYELLERLDKEELPANYLLNVAIFYECIMSGGNTDATKLELYNNTKHIESRQDAQSRIRREFEDTRNPINSRQEGGKETGQTEKSVHYRLYIILIVSVSIILLLVGAVHYYRRKKQLQDIILSKEKNIKQAKELISMKEKEVEKERTGIEEKEKELAVLNATNSKLAKQLEAAENDFRMLVEQNRELTKLTLMNEISDDAEELIEKIKKTAKGKYHLNDDEWKQLLGAIDRIYPEFTYEVQAKFKKVSEAQMRVCYLWKIGLSGPQIVNLTDYPRQTVWLRIKRIEEVFGKDE